MQDPVRGVVRRSIGNSKLKVSIKTCGKEILEGTSCTIKLITKNNEKPDEIEWYHLTSDTIVLLWKRGKIKKVAEGVSKEEDGSLTFKSVSLKDTGKYKYKAFNNDGTEIGTGEKEIQVYVKAPKPTVTFDCDADSNATLTCDTGNRTDLTLFWYIDTIVQNETNPQMFLTFTQIQKNQTYSCSVSNPVSNEQSPTEPTGYDPGPDTEVSASKFNFMVSILAGGGAFLLLLSVLIICACRSCRQQKKHQQDEGELSDSFYQNRSRTEHSGNISLQMTT
ncbi:T-cell surface antigen CD2-like isoform X1 [Labeo rohita]|uniref:T-cell surface antigen CD2-like isoform X1 n=1 Tax=Labeo rohita TaxID=84645 RepID=A0A498LZM6_LABRO|nr:T-cell surface antigen CD2-like isoform X1 [Labeo rohita]